MVTKRRRKTFDEGLAFSQLALVEKLRKEVNGLTPRQRGLAEFIIHNPESLAFLTITELAKKVGISEATITRFCSTIGYDGYAHLCREIQQTIQSELSTVGRFQLARKMGRQSVENRSLSAFERVLSNEIDNLFSLTQNIRTTDFYHCVDLMAGADQICIIGSLASSCLATYFAYMLRKIMPRVELLNGHDGAAPSIFDSLSSRSMIFLISFPRYPKVTYELGQWVAQKGTHIIAITNSPISPVVPLATISFFIPVGIVSFVDAYAAPIAFINALVTELSERNPDATQEALNLFDGYASRGGLFLSPGTKKPFETK